MLCNAISDERGLPRVISCALRNVATYAAITPWRCEQYKEREENLTEFTLA